ncbi:MAG: hypothetical protein GX248_10995 [Peptococcaceae bacterium]|jgi:hypothetical protein|nr:hypothetical protein [Peptococcaceae bacterium]
MIKISIEEFAKKYKKSNPDENLKDVTSRLKDALKRKKEGATCNVCGAPIWAIGSAVGGFDGCFTCITGEHDDSEDYEVF